MLAQFGGVTLAFAWLATLGFNGLLTDFLADYFGGSGTGSTWLYELPGLILVYTYFQIPLMVIVFLPALEGLRPQWREAAVNLGATTFQYWTKVALPLLRPAFLGSRAAAVRQRVRGVRHGGRAGQPGRADHPAADPVRAHQRGRPRSRGAGLRPGPRDGRHRRDRDDGVRRAPEADRAVDEVRRR